MYEHKFEVSVLKVVKFNYISEIFKILVRRKAS